MVTTYPDILARPYHAEQLKSLYDSGDTTTVDTTSAVNTTNTQFDNLVAAYPAETAVLNSSRTAILNAINGLTGGNMIDTLEQVRLDAINIITTDSDPAKIRIYPCPSCLATGTTEIDGIEQQDALCSGYSYTLTAKQLVPESRQWEDA